MNLQAKKLELVQLILNTEKPSILRQVEEVFKKKTDWWDEISEDERKSIEKGLAEANEGDLIPHEEVLKEVRSRYNLE
jgi:predicted transcriptional regulator